MEEVESEKGGDGVRAVDRALEILQAFGAGDRELTVAELLTRVDLRRPTLYRLLYTLEKGGFLSSNGDPQRFRLGPAIGQLAWAWTSSFDLSDVARPLLSSLWEDTGETVALFIPHGSRRICISELPSPQPLSFKRGIGYSERIVRGASGRALLAWMAPTEVQITRYCEGLEVDISTLMAQLEQARDLGYAVSHDELIKGAVAIAAPFFDHTGNVAGSIGIFGPGVRLDQAHIEQIAAKLRTSASALSSLLGYKAE
ncbi:IclR family transcriptional regulator [Herbaspirillum seropedicae]|uniref:IclR family transcriptional regulator n=1 Tax=Herbaspirillum seropedicae TaxID=964 RepID=UPI00285BD668|nr:IclR family transcriptional regulator [Herbaspirillum seropedicae]MDR6397482.1 DNA-binding IclR family transcriptional regulator [Herbaspirillum seropedicae]